MSQEEEALRIFFNVYQHVSEKDYNAKDGEYTRVLKHQQKKFDRFCSNNRFNVLPYVRYSKRNIILLAILNNLKVKSFDIQDNLNLRLFFKDIEHYKNNMSLDLKLVYEEIESLEDIYVLFREDKIHFYTFIGLIKYLKYDKKEFFTSNDFILKNIKHQLEISKLLDFKDYIKYIPIFEDIQKKLDLLKEDIPF